LSASPSSLPRVLEELEELKAEYADCTVTQQADGSFHVEILNLPLPGGWNQGVTRILVVVPVQYPSAMPSFFVDAPLRLADGRNPAGMGNTTVGNQAWSTFCWQPQSWDVSKERLWKFVKFILQRFMEVR